MGNAFVIILLFLSVLVHLPCSLLLGKVCAVPYQCLAITFLMSFAQAATNPATAPRSIRTSRAAYGPPANA